MSEPEASFRSSDTPEYGPASAAEPGRRRSAASPAGTQESFYSDAHYEPAGSTTAPTRFYTPPVRQERAKRSRPAREREKRSVSLGAVIALCLICAILGGLVGASMDYLVTDSRLDAMERAVAQNTWANEQNSQAIAAVSERTSSPALPVSSGSANLEPAEVYGKACCQVVWICTKLNTPGYFGAKEGSISGSGIILSEDGVILTNYHVIDVAEQVDLPIVVTLHDGSEYEAQILGRDDLNDLALLKIEATGLSPAVLGDSDGIRVGDEIYVVGNPLGELEFSMTTGHVSALDRIISTDEAEYIPVFQLDAAVNPGNSGGPVYNTRGEVIGVVTAKYSDDALEGLGFAIPSNDALRISQDLMTKGYVTGNAYMGIVVDENYNSTWALYYNMPLGAFVSSVEAGSAADRAGLRAGDIITAMDDQAVEGPADLRRAIRSYSAGDSVEIHYYRAGQELTVTLIFDERIPQSVSESPDGKP